MNLKTLSPKYRTENFQLTAGKEEILNISKKKRNHIQKIRVRIGTRLLITPERQ